MSISISVTSTSVIKEAPVSADHVSKLLQDKYGKGEAIDAKKLSEYILTGLQQTSSKHKFIVQTTKLVADDVVDGDLLIASSFGAVWEAERDGYISFKIVSNKAEAKEKTEKVEMIDESKPEITVTKDDERELEEGHGDNVAKVYQEDEAKGDEESKEAEDVKEDEEAEDIEKDNDVEDAKEDEDTEVAEDQEKVTKNDKDVEPEIKEEKEEMDVAKEEYEVVKERVIVIEEDKQGEEANEEIQKATEELEEPVKEETSLSPEQKSPVKTPLETTLVSLFWIYVN